jgi:transcriptional regulator with XRE-family HTH domain
MSHSVADVVARNIRATRSWQRVRQADMAARMGISRPTLSAIEAGRRAVTVEDLPTLCAILGVTLHDLFRGVDAETLRVLGLGSD